MSGGKFALPALAVSLLSQMMMAQHAAGAAANAVRGEGEDEERHKRLEALRVRFAMELREAHKQIVAPNALYPAHQSRLRIVHDEILAGIEQARNEKDLWHAVGAIPHLIADINIARMNQRFHEVQEARSDEDRLQIRLRELDLGLAAISTPELAALDPAGQEAAQRAVALAKGLSSNGKEADSLFENAAEAIALHGRRIAERRAEQMARNAHYERAATEMHAIVAGLRRDALVARWQAAALAELEALVQAAPISEETPFVMEKVREKAASMVKAASEAQFKADTRDYITGSIARSLSEMGFVVSEPLAEHPEHPATAKVFQASSSSGKSVLVSVPVEGQVWYEVDGYTKTTSASLSGDVTLDCDEGERVLEEMHARLDEEFHVEMSEIWWDGKDANRHLRRADALPVSSNVTQGAVR
jgi:hypothetical protein